MENQRNLDLDVFQPEEVREIFAVVSYSYTDRYESTPADEYGMWDAMYTEYTTTSERELSLGVISNISKFNEIKPNLDAIDDYIKKIMIESYSNLKDFSITSINIKYRVRENFDITKYLK